MGKLWPALLGVVVIGGALIGFKLLSEHKGAKLERIAGIACGAVLTLMAGFALYGFGYMQIQDGLLLRAEREQIEQACPAL